MLNSDDQRLAPLFERAEPKWTEAEAEAAVREKEPGAIMPFTVVWSSDAARDSWMETNLEDQDAKGYLGDGWIDAAERMGLRPSYTCSTCGKTCPDGTIHTCSPRVDEPWRDPAWCNYCGPACAKGACHNARTEAGDLFGSLPGEGKPWEYPTWWATATDEKVVRAALKYDDTPLLITRHGWFVSRRDAPEVQAFEHQHNPAFAVDAPATPAAPASSSPIERWTVKPWDSYSANMEPHPKGGWVKYSDHLACLARESQPAVAELVEAASEAVKLIEQLGKPFRVFTAEPEMVNRLRTAIARVKEGR